MGIIENKRVIVHRSRRMDKRRRTLQLLMKIVIAAILLFAVVFGIYMLAIFGKTKVNLNDLTTVTLSGYDSKGHADYNVATVEGLEVFFSTVEVHLDKCDDLSNDDEIKITYDYDKKIARAQNLKVKAKKEKIKVKDLPNARVISNDELFEAAHIVYTGAAPIAEATVENISTDPILGNIEFSIVDEEGTKYDIGDKITIEANVDTEALTENAVAIEPGPNGYQKMFEVEGVPQYIEDSSELTPEQYQQMKEKAAAVFSANGSDASEFGLRIFSAAGIRYNLEGTKYTFKWGNPIYITTYFNHIKPEAVAPDTTHVNDVKVVFQVRISQADGSAVDAEAVVIFRNICKDLEGNVNVDLSSAELISASVRDSDIKKLVRNEDDSRYESVRLDI